MQFVIQRHVVAVANRKLAQRRQLTPSSLERSPVFAFRQISFPAYISRRPAREGPCGLFSGTR